MGCAHSCQRKEVFGLRAQAGPSGHEVHNAAFSIENEGPEKRRQLHQTGEDGTKDAIAIVGIGCRTPGADNIRDFWRVLVNGECHVTDVPPDRWNAAAYLSDDVHAFGKAYVQKGGFIKGIEEFDNSLYGINDYEASQMDPQQRLLLDCTFMALEDAGFTRKQLSGSKTGVYIGSMNADHRSSSAAISSNIGSYTASSSANSFLSGRLSYVFNLLGPSVMIDTACSSSLIAIHLGCQAIHAGDCDQAICGGVNCMLLPDVFVHLSKARMISPSGLCHTFSDKADGYTRGEGCGIVILKRLTDALRDGDQVWATISTGTNQDGRTVTPVTAPSGEQQKKLLKDVYDKYPVDLSQLEYIEAHGTGTPTGDPVEVNAVGSFLKESGHLRQRYIGSVKTNIGHTESAAGALSVIKLCLMMKNNAIVPSLHCEVVNPNINITDFKLLIPKAPVPWLTPEKLTCCSSFGFGGSNCHAILQSVRREPVRKETTASSCIVCFSGKCVQSLKGSLEDLCRDPDASDLNVHDVSYTSTVRRDHYLYRAAFLAKDMQDLMNAVGQRLSHDQWPEPDISNQQKLVFVFCGMGTSWDGMCRQLLVQHQIFKDSVVEVERHLSAYVPWSLTERLMKEDPSQDSLLDPIAVFACQVGLAAVWKSLGIESNYIVGQSVGEVAAAYTAGCFSLADAVKIIYYRSQLLAEVANGAMIVVLNVEVDQVRRVLTECGPGASVSQEYSSRACAISAPSDVMQGVRRSLQTRLNPGAQIINLPVRVAYHSPHVSHCAEKLSTVLKGIVAHPPSVHLQSSVTGAPLTTSPDAEYWAKNIRQPVLLNQAMTGVVRGSPKAVFLEIGPRPVLQAHLKNMFPSQKVTAVPSMLKPPEMDTLLKAAIMLYEEGIDIAWTAMRSEGSELTQVPRYCFNKKHHVEKSEARLAVLEGLDFFHKDHLYTWPVRDNTKSFRLMISPLIIPSVYDHVLSGKIIVPGAFMAEASLAVAHYCGITHPAVSIEFEQATSVRKKGEVTDLVAEFESCENSTKGDLPTLIIKRENRRLASAQLRECGPLHQEIVNLDYIRAKCKNVVDKSDIYSDLHKFGFQYGPTYSLLEQACKTSRECLAVLKPTDSIQEEIMSTCLHPSILDNMLQSTALVIMENGNLPGKAILPKSIGHLVVHRQVEPLMYVYTRLKQVSAKQCVFDQQLLSPTGQVIADSVDFVIQFLQTQTQEPVLTHLTTEWNRIVDTPPAFFLNGKQREPSPSTTFLFVTDNDIVHNNGHCIAVSFLNETAGENLGDEIKEKMVSHPPSGVVLICSEDTGDNTEGSAVQDRVVTLCHVIQVILQTLKTMSLNIGFYVCTTHAWPSAARNADSTKINPVATAVWGLVRTIVLERVYSNITAVDLCFPSGLNGLYLPGVFSYLSDTESVESYPELMITPDGVFANQVVKDSSSPQSGSHVTGTEEVNGRNTQAADHLLALDYQPLTHASEQTSVVLQVQDFVSGGDILFIRKHSKQSTADSRQMMVAIEMKGFSSESPEIEVACCCPVTMKSEVVVPAETVLPTAQIPDYELGDITKLVVMWELRRNVQVQDLTILASTATCHSAELLKMLCVASDKMMEQNVNIVLLEDLENSVGFSGDVISMVYMDKHLTSFVATRWQRAERLVTYTSLMSPEAYSVMICNRRDVELTLLDTQTLFHPTNLKKTVPQVQSWINTNASCMKELARTLHPNAAKTNMADINKLIQFRKHTADAQKGFSPTETRFKKDAAYVVVGGLTGLGWICVEFLARHNAGCIAIINRSTPSANKTAATDKLSRQYKCQIKTYQADITSFESLRQIFTKIDSSSFQLRGVFMGAAVLKDSSFLAMRKEDFERVLMPKVKGAWNLHQLTKKRPLDHFVLHSSIVSVLGNPGQANYVTGNAFLDGLAWYRHHLGLAAQTINWGPLDTGILDQQDVLQEKMKSAGFHIPGHQEISSTLATVLCTKQTQTVPARIDPTLYAKKLYSATQAQPVVLRFGKFAPPTSVRNQTFIQSSVDMSRVKSLSPQERFQAYESYVTERVSHLVQVTHLSRDVSLTAMGMDSLSANQLLDEIQQDTGFKIPIVEIITEEATVRSLARVLDQYASDSGLAEKTQF